MAKQSKQVVVADFGVAGGVQLNPKDDGGTRWTVPYAKALKLAQDTGIDVYVQRIKKGKTLRMKPNNKVLVPALKAFKPAKAQASKPDHTPRKTVELTLDVAREYARKTGDWSKVEAILDAR